VQYTNPNVTALTGTGTIRRDTAVLIVHAILMTLKQMAGEEKLINPTLNKTNYKVHK
jgi:hypothetical protein